MTETPSRRLSLRRRLLYMACTVFLVLLVAEIGFRLIAPSLGVKPAALRRLRAFLGDGVDRYVSHPYTAFRFNPELPGVNRTGFRDREWTVEAAPGVTRIACLGASTTYGYNVPGAEQAYPRITEQVLAKRTGAAFESMNFGVPAWTSAEIMANYFVTVQDYEPDVVIVHVGINDVVPRERVDYKPDYSHFRQRLRNEKAGVVNRTLIRYSDLYAYICTRLYLNALANRVEMVEEEPELRRELTADSAEPFRRNVRSIALHAKARGAGVVLMTIPHAPGHAEPWPEKVKGLEQHNQILREVAEECGVVLLDQAKVWGGDMEQYEAAFLDIVHLSAAGHAAKGDWVAKRLQEEGVIPAGGE